MVFPSKLFAHSVSLSLCYVTDQLTQTSLFSFLLLSLRVIIIINNNKKLNVNIELHKNPRYATRHSGLQVYGGKISWGLRLHNSEQVTSVSQPGRLSPGVNKLIFIGHTVELG